MDTLKNIKETLMSCVQGQMAHLDTVNTKELGEAIDMIKDLEEAMYYCTITEAMKEKEKEEKVGHHYYYTEPYPMYRDMDKTQGRMYYPNYGMMYYDGQGEGGHGNGNSSNSSGWGSRGYSERPLEMMRDQREGRSGMSRKTYMESKEMHHDKAVQMRELEKYMHELSEDLTEVIEKASPEEKQILQQKVAALAAKIK